MEVSGTEIVGSGNSSLIRGATLGDGVWLASYQRHIRHTAVNRALSSGRPANDTVGDVSEEPAVGGVARGAGEWVAPPNTNPGTTANSPRPDTGRVTDVHNVSENKWETNNQVPINL
ncbi:hypothetical protein E2C01_014826 [Portunus trituberculatus]|uniref:Uncharacterized protein n=1 Tax=Portunus trituberculatus TaxID=210409 RepID=A0A5B7DLG8_PORTR|nr:hypothetical protein [Portunus trituberculatus]